MAGDWIKIQHALPDKPEVVQIASILGIDQDAVTGKLIRLWVWADQQTVNGNGLNVTETFLDRVTFATGFAQALRCVGWLTGSDGSLCLPNFSRHNGKTAKTRAGGQQRTKESRARNDRNVTDTSQKALPEKKREEFIYTPGPDVTIPERLNLPCVISAVGIWLEYLDRNYPDKAIVANTDEEAALWRTLNRWECTPGQIVTRIDECITNKWANLRSPESGKVKHAGRSSSADSQWPEVLRAICKLDMSKPYTEILAAQFGEKAATIIKSLGVRTIAMANEFELAQLRKRFEQEAA